MSANAQSLVGAVLSKRLRLTRVLGEGGMGLVFAAEALVPLSGGSGKYPADGRMFAVKLLRSDFLADVEVLGRFIEEGRTCQRLIHPNILRVFESAQAEDGTPYIVMELLDGVPLSAYTANGGRVPIPQAVTILQGILAGLAAAHAQGIVHRDLKPENVFLAREASGQFQIKLLDFGIAKVMDVAGGMGSRTRTGALLGTPAYMSPEQVKNPRNVDARSDLWSAGVMTWEMLTGRTAFAAPTEYARLAAVTTFTPDPLEKVDPQLRPISPIVERAMQKDPAQRFASALEMARAMAGLNPAPVPLAAPDGYTNPTPTPLSRLPAVASVFTPPGNGISPGASSERRTPIAEEQGGVLAARPGGGTLQSAAAVHIPTPAPPRVLVLDAPAGSTMPSHDLPVLEPPRGLLRRPIAAWIVVVLVLCALGAGFALGLAVARPM
jgi:eukaryotic-like serine/threonine-protein kinase